MKKTASLLIIMLLAIAPALAQYGTSKTRISFPVRHLPAMYSQEHVYHVNFQASRTVAEYSDYGAVCNLLAMGDGWQERRETGGAPVEITLSASDFLIEGYREDMVEEKVNRHGREVIERYFLPRIDYSLRFDYMFSAPGQQSQWYTNTVDGKVPVHSFVINKRFRTPHECHSFARDNKDEFLDKIIGQEILEITEQMQGVMRDLFLYYPSSDDIKICLFDSKKSPYYAKHQEAKAELRRIIGGIPLEGSLQAAIREMQPWISHFKELEEQLSASDKKQKAAKADMVYNLAMIYYALEVFDVSREYCMRLFNEFGENSGKRMLKSVNDLESQMKKHHLMSRHF